MLFSRAKNGASGKAETKIVTNPYCKTEQRNLSIISHKMDNLQACFNRFVGILLTHLQLTESQSIFLYLKKMSGFLKSSAMDHSLKHIIETNLLL
jgi:hemerythrin superfamily protein